MICVFVSRLFVKQRKSVEFTSWLLTFHCIVLLYLVVCLVSFFSRKVDHDLLKVVALPLHGKPCWERERKRKRDCRLFWRCMCVYRPRFLYISFLVPWRWVLTIRQVHRTRPKCKCLQAEQWAVCNNTIH